MGGLLPFRGLGGLLLFSGAGGFLPFRLEGSLEGHLHGSGGSTAVVVAGAILQVALQAVLRRCDGHVLFKDAGALVKTQLAAEYLVVAPFGLCQGAQLAYRPEPFGLVDVKRSRRGAALTHIGGIDVPSLFNCSFESNDNLLVAHRLMGDGKFGGLRPLRHGRQRGEQQHDK